MKEIQIEFTSSKISYPRLIKTNPVSLLLLLQYFRDSSLLLSEESFGVASTLPPPETPFLKSHHEVSEDLIILDDQPWRPTLFE